MDLETIRIQNKVKVKLNKCNLDILQKELEEWAADVFPQSTSASVLKHFLYEVVELDEAFKEGDIEEAKIEAADCLLFLCHFANKNQFSLIAKAREKLERNKKRKWGNPDGDGVVRHVQEGDYDGSTNTT